MDKFGWVSCQFGRTKPFSFFSLLVDNVYFYLQHFYENPNSLGHIPIFVPIEMYNKNSNKATFC